MRSAVVVFPGSNCDRDTQVALRDVAGAEPHMVWHAEGTFPEVDLIVLPGGFSYGDYLRAGAMAAHSPVMREVVARAGRGVPVLGICNGFQILCEAGLLPGVLMRNASLRFAGKDVHVRVETSQSIFTNRYAAGAVARMPVAHGDGNYYADDATLDRLEERGQIAFRYCLPDGTVAAEASPNGARRNIAGVFNEAKTVLGFMPHPERACDPLLGGTDGRAMIEGLAGALA
ncbi:MAG: phosphoribosylformylglycinamidine synthase subunit PurQ [Alphaproteobacteria bacterium]|nr:phosphoribosylformylglycinamidine synthase subunit PurQ [Alphaproteobacteria bacterium]